MDVAQFFQAAYGRNERYWWTVPQRYSTDPEDHHASVITRSVLRYARSRPPGRALDLGSGEGADAIRLALLGWQVDAVEISGAGAEKIERFARDTGVEVTVHHTDARAYTAPARYDLIVCNGLLHYLPDKEEVIRSMQAMTHPGGANAISCWSTFTPVPRSHRIVPTYPDDEDGVITRLYRDWRRPLHYFERNRLEASHDDMGEHVHSHIKMLAIAPPNDR
ncbi:class I SAM-dependent methyltransferase [Actinoallomurus sp. NPDC052308]|uniref:class I SAM-dependent methyltransferase n=1 Tax=Actinoallomurus sp. NPDC052308 TaxID=3155530 RepID=UPI003423B15A